jgi:hypothetical protein
MTRQNIISSAESAPSTREMFLVTTKNKPIGGEQVARIPVMKLRKLLKDVDAYSTLQGIWIGICPCHESARSRLTLRPLRGDRIELECSDGCDLPDILEVLGLELTDEFRPAPVSRKEVRRRALSRIEQDYGKSRN